VPCTLNVHLLLLLLLLQLLLSPMPLPQQQQQQGHSSSPSPLTHLSEVQYKATDTIQQALHQRLGPNP
jgi:hypothetical protein